MKVFVGRLVITAVSTAQQDWSHNHHIPQTRQSGIFQLQDRNSAGGHSMHLLILFHNYSCYAFKLHNNTSWSDS